jgi:hypothetical protein
MAHNHVVYACVSRALTLQTALCLRIIIYIRVLWDEVTGEWRRLHNEELNALYSSPNIIRVIKSRRMRWAGHVARMGERRGAYRVWWGDLREVDHLEDPCVDG